MPEAVSSVSTEVRLLRAEFEKHDGQDERRFGQVREELMENQRGISKVALDVANIKGRIIVLGGLAIVLIPALTELVHVFTERNLVGH